MIGTIIVGAVLVLLVGALLLGIWQKNNVKALALALTNDKEALVQRQTEQDKTREALLEKYSLILPGQDLEPVDTGEKTPGQETSTETGGEDTSGPTNSASNESGPEDQPAQEVQNAQEEIQAYVAQLYQVEDYYRDLLNQIAEETKTEFWSLPKEEQTRDNKMALVRTKTEELIAKEKECDTEVEQILTVIQNVLDREGSESGLVEEIRAHYEDCKATWKAACITELYK